MEEALFSIFNLIIGIAAFVIVIFLYLLPAYVASKRDHVSHRAIFWTNLFLGATGGGWLVCLIWALCSDGRPGRYG